MGVLGTSVTGAGGPVGPYIVENSVRLRNDSSYFTRTPSVVGNRTTWTLSLWIKKPRVDDGSTSGVFKADKTLIYFESNDILRVQRYDFGTNYADAYTCSGVFRDPSAWYHIVISFNSNETAAVDRVKFYINGVQRTTTYTQVGNTTPPGVEWDINNTVLHYLGYESNSLNGYLAEARLIDGQALNANSFGQFNADTGVWQPKLYSGAYGTNGFYQKYSSIGLTSGSNSGLGRDFSGNGNFYNTNGISLDADSTYDAMVDSPTPASETVGNYCILNRLNSFTNDSAFTNGYSSPAATLTECGLFYFRTGGASPNGCQYFAGTLGVSSGKWYWEWSANSQYAEVSAGVINDALTLRGFDNGRTIDRTYGSAATVGATIFTGANGNVYGMALDLDAGTLSIYENNVLKITRSDITVGQNWRPVMGDSATSGNTFFYVNFGQRPFTYTPPTGFKRLQTYNLATPTIGSSETTLANKYFDVVTYTGNNGFQNITSLGFSPGLVWIKERGAHPTDQSHVWFDTQRGATKYISSNGTVSSTPVETTDANTLTNFLSNGFTVGGSNLTSGSPGNYVAWNWASAPSASTDTAGTITSSVRANTTSGFSTITFTGNGVTGATIGHGLGATPTVVMVKNLSKAFNFMVYTTIVDGSLDFFYLNNNTFALQSSSVAAPTSTVFSVSAVNGWANESGSSFVAYAFAPKEGFSKFGNYVGTGTSNGPFVYTGFRPKFILVRRATGGGADWVMLDTSRSPVNLANQQLFPNLISDESTGNAFTADILSNGFKLRNTANAASNVSGNIYLYMAFAETPFNYSLAR